MAVSVQLGKTATISLKFTQGRAPCPPPTSGGALAGSRRKRSRPTVRSNRESGAVWASESIAVWMPSGLAACIMARSQLAASTQVAAACEESKPEPWYLARQVTAGPSRAGCRRWGR